jgi:hypothetical protein
VPVVRACLLVESTPCALLAKGLALPEDEIVIRFRGSAYEVRRGRVQDALKRPALRPPMRLIKGRAALKNASTAA